MALRILRQLVGRQPPDRHPGHNGGEDAPRSIRNCRPFTASSARCPAWQLRHTTTAAQDRRSTAWAGGRHPVISRNLFSSGRRGSRYGARNTWKGRSGLTGLPGWSAIDPVLSVRQWTGASRRLRPGPCNRSGHAPPATAARKCGTVRLPAPGRYTPPPPGD